VSCRDVHKRSSSQNEENQEIPSLGYPVPGPIFEPGISLMQIGKANPSAGEKNEDAVCF
jgi:hypothetical protein